MKLCWTLIACIATAVLVADARAEIIVDFEEAIPGATVESWTEEGVVLTPASPIGLLAFATNTSGHTGIFEALADIEIPIRGALPVAATSVTAVFWASEFQVITLQAFSKDGSLVDQSVMGAPDAIPGQPLPLFEMTVAGSDITSFQFTGNTPQGFVWADEVRITPVPSPAAASLLIGLTLRPRRRRSHDTSSHTKKG